MESVRVWCPRCEEWEVTVPVEHVSTEPETDTAEGFIPQWPEACQSCWAEDWSSEEGERMKAEAEERAWYEMREAKQEARERRGGYDG